MPILNRIKFDGTQNNEPWLIYKWEKEDIILGSQLIVGPGQEAIFVKNGQAQDVFASGTYTLSSGNLPFLGKLIKFPFGSQTPFGAEVYFINKIENRNMAWGTNSPLLLEDPKYNIFLSLRAFGSYVMSVNNSRLFLNKLIGSLNLASGFNHVTINRCFSGIINMHIKEIVSKFVNQKRISFLDITGYYSEISRELYKIIEEEFSSYGIRLLDFYIESISPLKEEIARLQRYKEELALGDAFYTKRRSFDVLEKMADSQVGDYAGIGMGLGAGMMVGSVTNQAMEQIASNIKINQGNIGKIKHCLQCGKELPIDAAFCSCCGCKQNTQEKLFCMNCGNELAIDAKFCSKCGNKVMK
ncbi:SPFH domain-containing protein [uncultured Phascolarctobacterium sp.]|uniref:SPFH domain-containing protein n=1 Tax=uncultured Phascolarctobacterium sp. TaxID=512296 RepID=UPI002620F942|nr:SPFH domain-containing protein [uncultured Phascolarctobacterium sp.]